MLLHGLLLLLGLVHASEHILLRLLLLLLLGCSWLLGEGIEAESKSISLLLRLLLLLGRSRLRCKRIECRRSSLLLLLGCSLLSGLVHVKTTEHAGDLSLTWLLLLLGRLLVDKSECVDLSRLRLWLGSWLLVRHVQTSKHIAALRLYLWLLWLLCRLLLSHVETSKHIVLGWGRLLLLLLHEGKVTSGLLLLLLWLTGAR